MKQQEAREILLGKQLKVTPQRLSVLESIFRLNNHPTVDHIYEEVRKHHPSIARGTVYNILEIFVDHGIISRVKTEKDVMHFDPILDSHHHIYCEASDRIEDYYDEDLDQLLKDYFARKRIDDFEIEDIKLQILGRFKQ